MKKILKESGDPFRDIVKKYAQYYRDSELSRIDKQQYNAWLQSHADKIPSQIRDKIKKQVDAKLKKNEASTTAGVPGVMTPFAFSSNKKSPGNVRAATQFGFKLAKPVNRSKDLELENQMYSEPAYITPAQNIEPVSTYTDKNGLVQHGDPEMDPALAGHEQGQLPMFEQANKIVRKMRMEGVGGLIYKLQREADAQQPVAQPTAPQPAAPQQAPTPKPQAQNVDVNLQSYDIQPDFTDFDQKLKGSTEQLKTDLQRKIQDAILDKKVVVRASKGYKQPEADYTINVTGVNIDYYYDRYVIVILGREESKQKVAKFFIKPGFKIKILGKADVKPKDQYQIAKSKALVDPSKQAATQPTNNVTSEEPSAAAKQTAGEKPPESQPTA